MQKAQYQAESLIAWSNLNTQLGGGFKLEPLGRNVSKKVQVKKYAEENNGGLFNQAAILLSVDC